jgi:hypothetical protein
MCYIAMLSHADLRHLYYNPIILGMTSIAQAKAQQTAIGISVVRSKEITPAVDIRVS